MLTSFHGLSAISVFSSVKCMFMSFLLIWSWIFFFTVLRVLYIILNTSALLATWFANIFQPAVCIFVLFIGKFHRIKVFNFDEVQFVNFPLWIVWRNLVYLCYLIIFLAVLYNIQYFCKQCEHFFFGHSWSSDAFFKQVTLMA